MSSITPLEAIEDARALLTGLPACLVGSAVVSMELCQSEFLADASDIDIFCYTDYALIAIIQKLQHHGYQVDQRFERVWQRWLRFGLKGWHTNSLKLISPEGVETNLVYKLLGRKPVNNLAAVLESFDFGLLGHGYDLLDNEYRDLRGFLFPGLDPRGPLPMMPNKRSDWRNGFISQYNGLREAARYAKYAVHSELQMEAVRDDLLTGYAQVSEYLRDRGDVNKLTLATIYDTISVCIEDNDFQKLIDMGKQIPVLDELDQLLELID